MVGRDKASPARTRAGRKRATSKKNVQHPISNSKSPPVALTIAGSDSSAGAGVQADLKTFSALGVYGLTAVTCVVAEIPGRVSRIDPLNSEIVREQIAVLAENFPIAAVKTGLLYSAEIVEAVARALVDLSGRFADRVPLVIDPVTVATSGDLLLRPDAIALYESELFPASPQEAKQERRHRIQNNGLTSDEQKGYTGIDVAMLTFEVVQPVPQEIKN